MTKVDRKLSVLFVLPNIQGGGAERVVLTVLRHLDRRRFILSLAIIDGREAELASDLPAGVEIVVLGRARVRYSAVALIRHIRKTRPDIVFSVLGHLNLLFALLKPVFPRVTRLIARETIVLSSNLVDNPFSTAWRLAYRLLLPRCDAIICQSRDMRDDLVRGLGLSDKNMVVVQNPVDVERIRHLSNDSIESHAATKRPNRAASIQLVGAGRLVRQKGFDMLVEAIALLGDARVHLTLVGDGPLRDELKRFALNLGVASRIHFVGFQKNPYPFFKSADAFVLSSRFEGMPNVVLEALACGTGVIATPAPGGVHELLEGRPRCLIAKSISARGLADAIGSYNFAAGKTDDQFALDEYSVERVSSCYAEIFCAVANAP